MFRNIDSTVNGESENQNVMQYITRKASGESKLMYCIKHV